MCRHVQTIEHGIKMGNSNPISGPYYLTIGENVAAYLVEALRYPMTSLEFFIDIALPAAL
jgi:hypothetical protein